MELISLRRAICSQRPYVCTSCRLAARRRTINTSFPRWTSTSTATSDNAKAIDEAILLDTNPLARPESNSDRTQTSEDPATTDADAEDADMALATLQFLSKKPKVVGTLKDASTAHLRTIARQVAQRVASVEGKSKSPVKDDSPKRRPSQRRTTAARIKEAIAALSALKDNPSIITKAAPEKSKTTKEIANETIAKLREQAASALGTATGATPAKAKQKKAAAPKVASKKKAAATTVEDGSSGTAVEAKTSPRLRRRKAASALIKRTPSVTGLKDVVRKLDPVSPATTLVASTTIVEDAKEPPPPVDRSFLRKAKAGAITNTNIDDAENVTRSRIRFDSIVSTIDTKDLVLNPLDVPQPQVPAVAYGLERVLFNPGVHLLQDPRSKVYNFDPYLQLIMPVAEFDFSALKEYITSSKDTTLTKIANENDCRYVGSTSSLSGLLSQFHFLISQWRRPTFDMLSKQIKITTENFTPITRSASAAFLRWNGEHYAVDADKQFDDENILSMLGKSLEKLLTLPTDDYEKYRKSNEEGVSAETRDERESYHYTVLDNFLMRSQLDAHHPRLPGTGMFDLKTRAVLSVRHDVTQFEAVRDYEIRHLRGDIESYEREYNDLIKNAFLKYSLQVRMGRMDGIFLAYHNTQRIFGFQYVPLSDMDAALHGQTDLALGNSEFKLSVRLLKEVFDRATAKFPNQTLRFHAETRDASTPFMYIFAEPVTNEEMRSIQETNLEQLQKFQAKVLGLGRKGKKGEAAVADEDVEATASETEKTSEIDRVVDEEALQEHDENGAASEQGTINTEESHASTMEEVVEADESSIAEAQPSSEQEFVAAEQVLDNGEDHNQAELTAESDDVDAQIENNEAEDIEQIVTSETEVDADKVAEQDITPEDLERPGSEGNIRRSANSNAANTEFLDNMAREAKAFGSQVDTKRPLLGMLLTIHNKVNEQYVTRPNMFEKPSQPTEEQLMNDWPQFTAADKWELDYSISTIEDPERAWRLYTSLKDRRKKALHKDEGANRAAHMFNIRRMRNLSKKGRRFRVHEDAQNKDKPIWVLGENEPRPPRSTPAKVAKPEVHGSTFEVLPEE